MDKKLLLISSVGYCLMIVSYTLGLVEKYNALIGLLITTLVVVIVLTAKYILKFKVSDSVEESDNKSNIGVNIKGKEILFEDIEQLNDSNEKIIGKDVKGDKIIFKNIRQ